MGLSKRDILDIESLSSDEIRLILEAAESFKEVLGRDIKKVPTLRGKTVINLFFEASTRTRTSFEIAAKRLSADTINISASASSVKKGKIEGLKVAVIGDIAHSRVARSNIHGLTKMGAKVVLYGPKTLIPKGIDRIRDEGGRMKDEVKKGSDSSLIPHT